MMTRRLIATAALLATALLTVTLRRRAALLTARLVTAGLRLATIAARAAAKRGDGDGTVRHSRDLSDQLRIIPRRHGRRRSGRSRRVRTFRHGRAQRQHHQ